MMIRNLASGILMGLIFSALLVACSDKAARPSAPSSRCGILSIEAGICSNSGRPGVSLNFADGHKEVFCSPSPESPGI